MLSRRSRSVGSADPGVDLLAKVAPKNTEAFLREFTRLVEQVNEVAVHFMKQKMFEKASEVLENCFGLVKAQPYIFLECFIAIRNNQGCLWKFIGKKRKALVYLLKADNILQRNPDVHHGVTYLNLSVLYSQLKEYAPLTQRSQRKALRSEGD